MEEKPKNNEFLRFDGKSQEEWAKSLAERMRKKHLEAKSLKESVVNTKNKIEAEQALIVAKQDLDNLRKGRSPKHRIKNVINAIREDVECKYYTLLELGTDEFELSKFESQA